MRDSCQWLWNKNTNSLYDAPPPTGRNTKKFWGKWRRNKKWRCWKKTCKSGNRRPLVDCSACPGSSLHDRAWEQLVSLSKGTTAGHPGPTGLLPSNWDLKCFDTCSFPISLVEHSVPNTTQARFRDEKIIAKKYYMQGTDIAGICVCHNLS